MHRHSTPFIPSRSCAVTRIGNLVQQRLGGHDLAVLAKAALRHLFVDPGLLQRVEFPPFGESFERSDFSFHGRGRSNARPNRDAVHDHCARPALAQPATKSRPLQAEVVAKNVEQRRRGIDIQSVRTSVHLKGDFAHSRYSLRIGECVDVMRTILSGCRSEIPQLGSHSILPSYHKHDRLTRKRAPAR